MENQTTDSTRETLVKDVDTLKRNAVQVAQDVKDHAKAHVDNTKQKVNDTLTYVKNQASIHPFTLLGIGFAAGWLFSWSRRA